MTSKEQKELARQREEYPIMKANALIQKSRYSLSLPEQRLVNYVCALIKPNEEGASAETCQLDYTIDLKDYCRVCGMDMDGNHIYDVLKDAFDALNSKCIWVPIVDENGEPCEQLVRWFSRVRVYKKKATVRLDEIIAPFLFNLKKEFTEFRLIDTLGMRSVYSMHLFEILKSYAFRGGIKLEVDELKRLLMIETIPTYQQPALFRQKVIDPAIKEINERTSLTVSYETIKNGRKVVELDFTIKQKDTLDRCKAHLATFQEMGEVGQPVKRGRGRPRKKPEPAAAVSQN